jgi:hypothetical protein
MVQRLFAIIAGSTVGILLAVGIFMIVGLIPFWLACILGGIGLAGMINRWRRPGSALVWSSALVLYSMSGISPWPAPWLVRDAEHIAGNRPYCIQVAEGGDYRQADSWWDFSPAAMRVKIQSDLAMQFHAILAVGSGSEPAVYNWSYRPMSWRKKTRSYATPVVSCMPKPSFGADLPYVAFGPDQDPDVVHLRLVGRSFTIPATYQPRAHATDSPYLRLIVDMPSLTPKVCRDVRACINHWIMIYLDPGSVMSWLDGPTTEATRLLDERAGPGRPVRTRIDCFPSSYNGGLNCIQHFLFDGALFSFHMREADLGNWRQIQDRLIALFRELQTT